MARYIGKRLLVGLFSLWILVTATFLLTRLMPGSPFQMGGTSREVQEAVEREYGLKEPIAVQYGVWIGKLARGDLGISLRQPGVSVSGVIARAWPVTAALGGLALLAAAAAGISFGVWQAVSERRTVKAGLFLCNVLGSSIPNFAAALLLLLIFGVKLKWFPIAGLFTPAHYVLPVLSLAMYPAAVTARLTYQSVAQEMGKEYVTMARAKGLGRRKVILSHVMRHACFPVLNYLGPAAAFLVTGSFVVESIFTIPGLGREFVSALTNRDYTMIMGLTVFMGAVVTGVNLLTDLLCAALNPKVRTGYVRMR